MDERSARIYVRQLRYFYQELVVFASVALVICLPFFFNNVEKMFLIALAWGGMLALRGQYFELSTHLRSRIQIYSQKLETYAKKWEQRNHVTPPAQPPAKDDKEPR